MKKTKICKLLNIDYPIIQGGMVWVSGANLAAACSEAGCLGVIGAGSMKPDLLKSQIIKAQTKTKKSLAVNIPIFSKYADDQIRIAVEQGIKIIITSAGSPKKYTSYLKENGCKVIHVTSSLTLAKKCEDAGVDAIVIEGFEAGGHNGRDEMTTLVLLQQLKNQLQIPVIAAGGFSSGDSILAAMALGADGVQMGTRFMLTKESRAHDNFKHLLLDQSKNGTMLSMKKLMPVRLVMNEFYEKVKELEDQGADPSELEALLGHGRAMNGIHHGDLIEGELESGQICAAINDIPNVSELVMRLKEEYDLALENLTKD